MIQRVFRLLLTLALLGAGCDAEAPSSTGPRARTVASLTPAGTNLLVRMGLADRIVGISPYDADAALKARLPKVGDYERIDWEQIARLQPGYLIVQGQPDRLPAGLNERAREFGVQVINLQIDRLADIDGAISRLGDALDARDAAADLSAALRRQLEQCRSDARPVRAMIVLSENGLSVAGRENYLNDLLELAGGENVITRAGYPTIDQEMLLTLRPQVIFMLLPGEGEATVKQALDNFNRFDALPAVAQGRVYAITSPDALLPASNVVELAGAFSARLGEARAEQAQP